MAFKQRHIDGLKGVACLLIMFGHYSGLYKYAQNCSAIDAPFLRMIPYSLISEGFWLRLFYVLSGYLVSRSKVLTVRDLMRKAVLRFFRLALPILGAALFILPIARIFGLHTADIQDTVANQWMLMSYSDPLTLKGAAAEPFRVLLFGQSTFNPVWWVLRDMFLASLLIYLSTWIRNRLSSGQRSASVCADLVLPALLLFFIVSGKDIYFSVLIGALYGTYEAAVSRVISRHEWVCWILLFAPLAGFHDPNIVSDPGVLCLTDLAFVCFVIAAGRLKLLNAVFSELDRLGGISFGIYSLHWPVFCSVGLLMIMRGIAKMPGSNIYLLAVLVSALITSGLSVLFRATVERWSAAACRKLDCLLASDRKTAS